MAIANDGGDARECGKFPRSTLRVATGNDNARGGVATMSTANIGTGFAIRFGRDAASVDHDNFGGIRIACCAGGCFEACSDGFAVGARCTAAEVLNVETGHSSSLVKICCVQPLAAVAAGALGLERTSLRSFCEDFQA